MTWINDHVIIITLASYLLNYLETESETES